MARYVRFAYATSGKVHFLKSPQSEKATKTPVCNQEIKTSGWEGTTAKRHGIKGNDICGTCLRMVDVPWEEE